MDSTELNDLMTRAVSRRAFARKTLTAGLAVAGAAVVADEFSVPSFAQQRFVDADILQFALNLEYLEAEFYTVATTGRTLKQSGFTTSGQGTEGDTTGGAKVTLTGSVQTAAEAITRDEQAHVLLLQGVLGSRSISKPAINLEALGLGFRNQNEFLTLARAFEDVGVSAYGGAAPLIRDSNILGTAARILATEAEHTGILRLLVSQTANLTVPAVDGKDILPLGSPNGRLVSADDQGLPAVRTPYEVLSIVYGGGRRSGGFFPAAVNGAFNQVL